jgi:hypothetical protein
MDFHEQVIDSRRRCLMFPQEIDVPCSLHIISSPTSGSSSLGRASSTVERERE